MAQHLFNSDSTSTGSDKGVLDQCFTDLYDLREHISTPSYTASTPWLNFSSLGNLGVGTAPISWSSLYKAISFSGGSLAVSSSGPYLTQNLYNNGSNWVYSAAGTGAIYLMANGFGHQWFNAPSGASGAAATITQAMSLAVTGDLLVGTTIDGYPSGGGFVLGVGSASTQYIGHATGSASGSIYAGFVYNTGPIGSITQNGTTGVAYNTSSDYRLKASVTPIAGSGAFIDALKPCTWTWISDGTAGAGFIAHELQAVSPSSVTGTKDATQPVGTLKDADGVPVQTGVVQPQLLPAGHTWVATGTTPIYQAVEYGSAEVIAMLVAEVQSLRARLAAHGL